jgi:DNA-directed RNA polymerase specialized sigma24 family protein
MATFIKLSPATVAREGGGQDARPLDVERVHAAHADFVFRSLSRLGVREPDLLDMLQEVFVIVHRRAGSYDGTSKLTSWLFGICLRVAAGGGSSQSTITPLRRAPTSRVRSTRQNRQERAPSSRRSSTRCRSTSVRCS